ncbi:hypothetical protein ACGF5F_32555 [Streptomyces sp. NPDC047821]|uniref:hypothetical protein n=1 Tax=Streptomyces sp. NPDC047821 TaxID=3365488 RepID=UPI00371659D3
MPKWALTATSRTGQKVNPLGGSSDTITVYDQADLDRRVEAAKSDPRDLDVKVKRLA